MLSSWLRDMTPVLLLGLVFVSGCGTRVSFTPTNSPPGPMRPRPASAVGIFTTGKPDRSYVEVGVFEAKQASQYSTSDETEVVAKMREAAGKQGCDALVITGSADSVVGSGSSSQGTGSSSVSTLRGFRGTCIMFKAGADAAKSSEAEEETAPKQACVPGSTQECTGPGGCKGGQSCNTLGSGFTPCDCGSASAPADAGAD